MKLDTKTVIRQGDVFFIRVFEADLSTATPKPPTGDRHVIREGEATGHAHAIAVQDGVQVLSLAEELFVLADVPVEVEHEEHDTAILTSAIWYVPQQVEYTPAALRRVLD
jgi:hypothetical protein